VVDTEACHDSVHFFEKRKAGKIKCNLASLGLSYLATLVRLARLTRQAQSSSKPI
jgi:hypothetical protein